ncbi:hypothetical protein ACEPAF_968 [Sanghuangporus sanghuang]
MSSSDTTSALPVPTDTTSDSGDDDDSTDCGSGNNPDIFFGLRVASVFIIMISSMIGAFFPIIARRSRLRNVIPREAFDFGKYFGSGVIIATAFIHLLDPAIDELGSPCLTGAWTSYPWALALCMLSIFLIFFAELIAFRWGTAKLQKLGITYDAHGHDAGSVHAGHGPETGIVRAGSRDDGASQGSNGEKKPKSSAQLAGGDDVVVLQADPLKESAISQIIGIFILEFGIILHSVLIGLTLAVDPDFKVLFVVLVFHQMFEGLGLGSRLAYLTLPIKYNYVAYVGALAYGLTTPIGIAAGLGVRTTYNPDSKTASIVSGVMDALSAGVLIYTGLVELLAHEFLFSPEMQAASNKRLTYVCLCMLSGAGIMALLGRWA